MEKTYKFRLYPSNKHIGNFNFVLNNCRFLYNSFLEFERFTYESKKGFLAKVDLNNLIPDYKIINPNLKKVHSQVLQNVSDRLIKSFDGFFRRVKTNKKAGFPRFKNIHRYNSFTFPQSGFKFISNKKLQISKIGEVNIRLHRMIKGKIKTLTIKKTSTNKWFACFSVQQDKTPLVRELKKVVGLDLGLKTFATLSDGSVIENERYLKKSLDKIKLLSKRLSSKTKGSSNRNKSRVKLALLYEKIFNQRLDFLHKLSYKLVNKYDGIALEKLKVSSMMNKYLQLSINDVSWTKFAELLTYKAEETGCKLDFVNPKNTSKTCSKCGNIKKELKLSERTYNCSNCGFTCCRDLNASFNILNLLYFHSGIAEGTSVKAFGDETVVSSMN